MEIMLKPAQEGRSIPKIIHQTYANKNLPPEIEANIETIKNLNPDWDYRFYDDQDIENYLSEHFPWSLVYYRRIKPNYGPARADFFRYLLMYNEGGVYLDVKSSLSKPLNEVIQGDDRFLLSHWRNEPGEKYERWGKHPEIEMARGEFQQWHIVSAPGHAFLKTVIQKVCNNIDGYNPYTYGVGKRGVLRTTGPIPYSMAILPLLESCSYRLVDAEKDLGFIYSIFKYGPNQHRNIFKTDYTGQRDSPIRISPIKKLSMWLNYKLFRYWPGP